MHNFFLVKCLIVVARSSNCALVYYFSFGESSESLVRWDFAQSILGSSSDTRENVVMLLKQEFLAAK